MTIIHFILAYLIIDFCMPIVEKLSEFLVTLIHLGTAKISLHISKIQKEVNDIVNNSKDSISKSVIGFQLSEDIDDSDIDEDY